MWRVTRFDAKLRWRFWSHALIYLFGIFKSWQVWWERDKVIERCESSWASPIHAVMKSDGSWRVCGDFRRINTVTQLDRYPLPTLSSFNERLVGCTVFSKVDLKQAFQQVCVEESSQEKTAIITTLGLFKFLRMPFGLKKRGPMLPAKRASASERSAIRNIHLHG